MGYLTLISPATRPVEDSHEDLLLYHNHGVQALLELKFTTFIKVRPNAWENRFLYINLKNCH